MTGTMADESMGKGQICAVSQAEIDRQREDWRQLPFVRVTGEWETDPWVVPQFADKPETEDDENRLWECGWNVGTYFGREFIGYARRHPEWAPERLRDIVKAMTEREWTAIECGFFTALGDYIATGEVLGHGWTATLSGNRMAA
jgi:hypothetical protein